MEKYRIPDKYRIPMFSKINQNFKKLYNGWIKDADNKLPMEIGLLLEDLHESDEYIFGLHKTSAGIDMKIDIFQNGLTNSDNNIENTVAMDRYFPLSLRDMYGVHGSRRFNGAFLIVVPKKDVGFGEGDPDPIYYYSRKNDDISGKLERRLKPEYIQAYISVEDNENGEREFKVELKSEYEKYFDPTKKRHYTDSDLEYDSKVKEKINEIKR